MSPRNPNVSPPTPSEESTGSPTKHQTESGSPVVTGNITSTRVETRDASSHSSNVDSEEKDPPSEGWVHPPLIDEQWELTSREYVVQGTSREQPLFAFHCGDTAGLCLIDSGATLNLVSEDFVIKARLVSKPLRSPLGVAPFEGPLSS